MLDVINIEVHFFQAPLKEQAPPYTSSHPRVLAINQSSATTRSIFQKKKIDPTDSYNLMILMIRRVLFM